MIPFLRHSRPYLIATALCLVGQVVEFRLWRADPHVPFYYDAGDDIEANLAELENVRETGWIMTAPRLSAPGIQEIYDSTPGDNLQWFLAKLIGEVTPDLGTMVNACTLVFILLTTWSSLYAIRRLGISGAVAVVLALLYAFQPNTFVRAQRHLGLSCNFSVPLIILVALWLCEAVPVFAAPDDRGRMRPRWIRGRTLPALFAAVTTGSSGAYLAFFGVGSCAVAALMALLRTRKLTRLVDGLLVATVICAVFALNLGPRLWYDHTHGSNPAGNGDRSSGDSLRAGLSISAMLRPVHYHGSKSLAMALLGKTREVPSPGEINERIVLTDGGIQLEQPIGLIASCAFLLLLLALFSAWRPRGGFRLLWPLSRMNLAYVLVGTIGGFGYLFATTVTPMIRCWGRLNIYIAFVSMIAVGMILDHVRRTRVRTRRAELLFGTALVGLLVFGLIDQMSQAMVPTHEHAREQFDRDRAFVRAIEAALPEGAMVFQLPWLDYPANIQVHGDSWHFNNYVHLVPYLHSTHVRWSAGAVRGRGVDRWQERIAEEPLPQMVDDLKSASFRGIYVDRRGYDKGTDAPIVDGLKKILGIEPIADSRGDRLFFALPAPAAKAPAGVLREPEARRDRPGY